MTTGALIFAFNNEQTDYLSMAAWNAARIKRYLDIPVAVVTDAKGKDLADFDRIIWADAESGGTRYFDDYGATVTWHNAGRVNAYNLTPWERTLVLDADYVVDSDNLVPVLESPKDFLCFAKAYDITSPLEYLSPNFGRHKFPMYWATVMMFRKTSLAQYIFDTMHMIKQNWNHYRAIYGIHRTTYRNDYALSIALALVNGHTLQISAIPWSMPSVLPDDDLSRENEHWKIRYQDPLKKPKEMIFKGLDFHAMGKRHLETIIANHA